MKKNMIKAAFLFPYVRGKIPNTGDKESLYLRLDKTIGKNQFSNMFCFGVENFGSLISSAKNCLVGAVSAVGRFAAAKVGKED